jgi:predicted nucleic acid-binding protein
MNVLIDTNVVLDVLLGREPFAAQSAKVIFLSEKSVIDGYVSASAATESLWERITTANGVTPTKNSIRKPTL